MLIEKDLIVRKRLTIGMFILLPLNIDHDLRIINIISTT